jgi:hypothetical protein
MQHEMMNQDIFSEAQVAQRVWGGDENLSANLKRLAPPPPPPPVPNISTPSPILKVEIVDEERKESFDEDDEEFGDFVSAPVKPAPMPMPIPKPIHTLVPANPFKQPIYAVREDEEDDLLLPKSDSSDLDSDVSQFLWLELLARDAAARTVQRHDKNALIQLPADDEDDMASDVLEFLKPARQVARDAAAASAQPPAWAMSQTIVHRASPSSIIDSRISFDVPSDQTTKLNLHFGYRRQPFASPEATHAMTLAATERSRGATLRCIPPR